MPERLYEEPMLLVADEREQVLGHAKREKLVDVVQACLAGLALLCLLPLLSLVALVVKLTSPGPVLYRGLRVGRDEKIFTIYKFRTLDVGAERDIGARLLKEQDHYYTPIGRFLKRTKLDEWPQLWNVIKGDMRFIGPRPVPPIFLDQFTTEIPRYAERFQVKPGITGLAQLRGGYYTRPQDKLRYELLYIRHYSALFDLKILLLTLVKLFHRWLSLGVLFLALFLFVSFTPASLLSSSYLAVWGIRFNVVHVIIGLTVTCGGWFLSRRLPHHRLSLYRLPLYLPMGVFIVFSLAAAVFSPDPNQALRGAAYYGVTGFLIALAIANSQITLRFVRQAMSVVAATAVAVSAIGLLQLLVKDYLASAQASSAVEPHSLGGPGMTATLGSSAALSVYLTLAVPYLLCRLIQARERGERDFWVGGAIITFIGIVLTKTPLGLCAAALTVAVYMIKYFRLRILSAFVLGIAPFLFLSLLSNGFLPSLPHLLLGYGARVLKASWPTLQTTFAADAPPDSGFVTLLLENGILGGGAMLWVVGTALFAIYRAYREVADEEIRSILWAVFCSILGFLISLAGFNAFSDLTLQVLFWGTVGIGLGVVTHLSGRRKEHLIDLKLGH
jgi:lipopolysaccharide/colanic/teichoic acid biosynthesis glycosyltransferase